MMIPSFSFAQKLESYEPEPFKREVVEEIVNNHRAAMVEKWKKETEIEFWFVDARQAGASLANYNPKLTFYSRLMEELSAEDIALVTCHELGHLLGEISYRQSGHFFYSHFDTMTEGEADYWGGKCILNFVRNRDLREKEVNSFCAHLANEDEKEYCSKAISIANNGFKFILKVEKVEPELALSEVYKGIDYLHPNANCRALSAINGIIGSARPKCWYNPQ